MNNDLISREDLKKTFEETVCIEPMPYAFVKQIIDNAPTVEERPHGKWIEHQDCHDDTYYTCSHCGEDWTTIEGDPMDNLMNYCPMCGADMREADNDKV